MKNNITYGELNKVPSERRLLGTKWVFKGKKKMNFQSKTSGTRLRANIRHKLQGQFLIGHPLNNV